MPAESEKQRRFMGAELARKRAGKATRTDMTEKQLRDFAKKPEAKNATRSSPPATGDDLSRGYKPISRHPMSEFGCGKH